MTTTTEEPTTIPYRGDMGIDPANFNFIKGAMGPNSALSPGDLGDEAKPKGNEPKVYGFDKTGIEDYDDDSDEETTTFMTTTTEKAVDIVEFECNTKWKGTLKMQDVNYYEVS